MRHPGDLASCKKVDDLYPTLIITRDNRWTAWLFGGWETSRTTSGEPGLVVATLLPHDPERSVAVMVLTSSNLGWDISEYWSPEERAR